MLRLLLSCLLAAGVATVQRPSIGNQKATPAKTEPFVRRLGIIRDGQGRIVYHVVAKHWMVPAALEPRGHSTVFFYNQQWERVATYTLGLPDELPTKLTHNTLYFTYRKKNNEMQTHRQTLGSTLPPMLCVTPVDRYTKKL